MILSIGFQMRELESQLRRTGKGEEQGSGMIQSRMAEREGAELSTMAELDPSQTARIREF